MLYSFAATPDIHPIYEAYNRSTRIEMKRDGRGERRKRGGGRTVVRTLINWLG